MSYTMCKFYKYVHTLKNSMMTGTVYCSLKKHAAKLEGFGVRSVVTFHLAISTSRLL